MTETLREAPHHNTLTCYTHYGCRRPSCVERKNAWCRERDRGLRAGTWKPRADAGPVREHLKHLLDDGITIDAIARTVGVPRETLLDFTQHRRPGRSIRYGTGPQLAARILAVTPDSISAGRVDAIGCHRRIQALVAAGWPLLHIGRQFGMHEQRPEQILRSKRVYMFTRRQVVDGYERVVLLRPGRRGVPKDKARQSRERGKASRWPTPDYWSLFPGALDDPDFVPDFGKTRAELLAENAHWLVTVSGMDRNLAAERIGVDRSYLDRALAAHSAPGTEVAA